MTLHIRDGGSWETTKPWVREGGAWVEPKVWVRDGGVWKVVHNPVPVTVTISPSSYNLSSTSTSQVFPNSSISFTGGTPSSFFWSIGGIVGGTWSISSGQGTNVARALVTNVPAGGTASCTFQCSVVIDGQTYNRSMSLVYQNTSGGGGGPLD